VFGIGLTTKLDVDLDICVGGHSHRRFYQRGMVMRSESHMEGSGDRRPHAVSSSKSSSGRWECWDPVVDLYGLVGVSDLSPVGMGRRMGRCKTEWNKMNTCSISSVQELTLAGSFISIQDPSMSKPVFGL